MKVIFGLLTVLVSTQANAMSSDYLVQEYVRAIHQCQSGISVACDSMIQMERVIGDREINGYDDNSNNEYSQYEEGLF